jgi:NAD(P) transhydrogenase
VSRYDVLVVGTGPAGLHAATEAAQLGAKVAVIEKGRAIGGACVHRGTIPSKTLREAAVQLSRLKRSAIRHTYRLDEQTEVATLMGRLDAVVAGHVDYMTRQVAQSGAELIEGRARFVGDHRLRVDRVRAEPLEVTADKIIIAVGSRPRRPPEIAIDHENVLDSDSILSMIYLPESLTVLGGGVIACEWASIFTELGVKVTLIDRGARPLAFMDEELTARFVESFEAAGSRYLPNRKVTGVSFDGVSEVATELEGGDVLWSRKVLCALGRVANLDALDAAKIGLAISKRGHLEVDEHGRSSHAHIYGVGDVVGFPALAATSMEQGRRAARHALGLVSDSSTMGIPVGIFTIPELSSVGLTEEAAREQLGPVLVGRACFDEVARGHISGIEDGILKLVVRADDLRIVGAHIVGDGATELVGIAQMAMAADMTAAALVENIFNFPTLAEAYRIAALDVLRQREQHLLSAAQ